MPAFSEPERFLLEHWLDARLLENAMKAVREKYAVVLQRALEKFHKNHAELNCPQSYLRRNGSSIGIGKTSWPLDSNKSVSGFWIENLYLDNLLSQEQEPPYKLVWIYDPPMEPKEAEARLRIAAEELLSKEEVRLLDFDFKDREAWFWCWLEQPREELLKRLVKNEASGFISCMVDHFEWMAKFSSVLDEIVKSPSSTYLTVRAKFKEKK